MWRRVLRLFGFPVRARESAQAADSYPLVERRSEERIVAEDAHEERRRERLDELISNYSEQVNLLEAHFMLTRRHGDHGAR